jgi:SIR2-like domain
MPLTDEIKPIPDLPEGLREAAVRGTLIPFVGAGASRIAGCPNWSEFADSALRSFVELGRFSHAQLDQIKHLNPRIKMSIALSLERTHTTPINFERLLYPSGNKDSVKGQRLYAALSRLGKTFVTTNYDEWLDRAIDMPGPTVVPAAEATSSTIHTPRNVCYRVDDLTADNLLNRPNTVIHLHGSLRDPDEMVPTTPQYLLHYANDRLSGDSTRENKVLTFLEILFRQRTVLFVGYGLEELEVLEYIIVKARPPQQEEGRREIRHYLLQGFFSHEQELMLHLMSYYGEFGIQLIPFLRDEKDWDQLIDVLDDFARHAPASDPMKLQTLLDMEGLLVLNCIVMRYFV